MNNLELDIQIYNASKSLKYPAFKFTRDMDQANDLIQETLLKALKNKSSFKTGTNIKAWLYMIMKNTFISGYHKNKRSSYVDPIENAYELVSSNTIEYNAGTQNLNLEEINNAISNLSDTFKQPFMMHFSGYKYEEIAEMLDLPMGTVKNRIHVARKILMENLKSLVN